MKQIALLHGGFDGEHQVSKGSAENIINQYQSFQTERNNFDYQLTLVEVTPQGFTAQIDQNFYPLDLNDFSFSTEEKKVKFDGIFLIVHGRPIEDGTLQGYFDLLNIPYLGSNGKVSQLTFNKYLCNRYLSSLKFTELPIKFKTAEAQLIKSSIKDEIDNINNFISNFPLFVKPNSGGSSIGAGKADNVTELKKLLLAGFESFDEYLVEEYLPGRELTCGCFLSAGKITVLPPTEIITKNTFFDYAAKYEGASEEITPANISDELTKKIQSATEGIFRSLNCQGFARADFMVVEEEIYFIEINTLPGFTEQSLIPQQLSTAGISAGGFIHLMLHEIV